MDRVAFQIFGRDIYWYGLIIAFGVMMAVYFLTVNAKRDNVNQEILLDFALIVIPFSVIGTRLFYVIFKWDHYKNNLIDIFKINEGGMAIYGGIITGVAVGLLFCWRKKINVWFFGDIVLPSAPLGQAIGRWGNFFNQEAYGREITNPSWQWFPAAVVIESNQKWHMATFFYESIWNFAIVIFFILCRNKRKVDGEIFILYFILYSIGRFVIEGLRTDSLYWGTIRVSQLVSAILFIIGVALYIYIRKYGKRTILPEPNTYIGSYKDKMEKKNKK